MGSDPVDDQEPPQQPADAPLEPVPESDTMRQLREAARVANTRSIKGRYYGEASEWP